MTRRDRTTWRNWAGTEAVDPLAVRARPVASRIVQATPQQQLAQSMPTPLQILPGIIPRSQGLARRARASAPAGARRSARSPVARYGCLLVANQHRDEQILLVCIDAHVRSNVLHDRLPSMRLWRSRALIRDLVALTTVLSAATHYNVTMESRSFHIV